MRKRTVFWRAAAALLVFALLLPAFGSAMAVVHPQPKDEDDEPEYDLVAYAMYDNVYERFYIDANDPSSFERLTPSIEPPDVFSSIIEVDGRLFASQYGASGDRKIYELGEDFSIQRTISLTVESINFEDEIDSISDTVVWAMSYSEEEQICYALVNVNFWTTKNDWIGMFGIAELDLETGFLSFIYAPWWRDIWSFEGTLFEFWPVTMTYMGDGQFLVVEAWENKLVSVDITNGDPDVYNYNYICMLPELATLFPLYMSPEPYMPSCIAYFPEDGTALWGSGNSATYDTNLIKIDVSTGEIIFDANLHAEGMPLEPPEGEDIATYQWPLLFHKVPKTSSITLGDVDGSGAVTVTDALLVMRYAMGIIGELANIEAADVNNSGTVDVTDALLIMRIVLGV